MDIYPAQAANPQFYSCGVCEPRATLSLCPYDVMQCDGELYLEPWLDFLPERNGMCFRQQLSLIQCFVIPKLTGSLAI